jgi:hypothetical protein
VPTDGRIEFALHVVSIGAAKPSPRYHLLRVTSHVKAIGYVYSRQLRDQEAVMKVVPNEHLDLYLRIANGVPKSWYE